MLRTNKKGIPLGLQPYSLPKGDLHMVVGLLLPPEPEGVGMRGGYKLRQGRMKPPTDLQEIQSIRGALGFGLCVSDVMVSFSLWKQ